MFNIISTVFLSVSVIDEVLGYILSAKAESLAAFLKNFKEKNRLTLVRVRFTKYLMVIAINCSFQVYKYSLQKQKN